MPRIKPATPSAGPEAASSAPKVSDSTPVRENSLPDVPDFSPGHKDFDPFPFPTPILVSACLCGITCRWDGQAVTIERLAALHRQGLALAVCPEVDAGLACPRPPCELRDGRVLTPDGTDLTAEFQAGAARTLRLAQEHNVRLAVLKERSPSCGSSIIYDGSFTGVRIPGQGVTAALLAAHGIRVVNEDAVEELFRGG